MARQQHIDDRAAEWADALQHQGDDASLRQAVDRWCAEDPEHAEAFARIDRAYRVTRGIEGSAAQQRLRQQTLARVAALKRRRQRRRVGLGLAAAVVVAVGLGIRFNDAARGEWQFQQARALHALQGEALYRTAVGEQRTVALDDGSTVILNTDSQVVVRYADTRRDLDLLRGQALFEVAHDAARPFVVHADGRTVTALGTAFDVRLAPGRFEVTLLEGRIEVAEVPSADNDDSPRTPHTVLSAGQQLLATAEIPEPVIRQTDARRATSWREGLLLFEGENLAQAVAEMNRYGGRRIELTDPAVGRLHISGAFKTGKPEAFLETLSWYLPIRVIDTDEQRILVGQRG